MSETRKQLQELIEAHDVSQAAIGRGTGLSGATISQYLSGKYPGDMKNIDDAIASFISRWTEKNQTQQIQLKVITTSTFKKFREVARICHIDGEMGVCYGDAGIGKTIAAKAYAKKSSDVILIEADLGYTARDLFRELHRKLGMDAKGTLHELLDDCVSKLQNSGRMIIVDEAEHLPYRALEMLRRIYDKAGIGILLCGMPRLIANLRGKKGEYAQLYSRIGIAAHLQALNTRDTEEIVTSIIPTANGLCKVFHDASHANARVLSKLIRRSMRVATINDRQIDSEVIKTSAESLLI
jgi:DNA transposition AAA+ family ATPase